VTAGETHRAIEATFRIERARLIAGLARLMRNVDLAEELAQDALVVALSEWPRIGVPANPGAWLMALAKRRAIDALRRDKMRERKHEEIARTLDETSDGTVEAIEAAMDDDLGDELLGLIFTACHPILSPDARAALTLRVVGGLTTDEIARAFLSSEVVDLNRAIAHGMAFGPEAGLRLVDEIANADTLRNYAPLPAARGDFLFRAGRLAEARSEFKAAATLTRNVRERAFLLARADACDGQH
jgi:RNA polymerase sigma factor (sigma-70 family)